MLDLENRPGRLVLGRYELMEEIGRGGFATVYRAHDRKMGREVAVKAVLRGEQLGERATREARAAAKLSHPHIVTVFELAEDDHQVYLVSELIEGRTLKRRIDVDPLCDEESIHVTMQVLAALAHAHDRGVVHRDIKPDNIMIATGRAPSAKVMDFGIARLEDTHRITSRGDVVGTLSYMSPEQADGRPVDGSTDVYSAALTLYECLTGANPFRAPTAAETIGRIQAGALPLTHVRPDLPAELSDLVEDAMEPDPQLRLGLRSFAVGLEQVVDGMAPSSQEVTTVIRRSEMPHRGLYEDLARRFGWIAARIFSGGVAALVAYAAVFGSDFYPAAWRLPLVLGAAILVGALPRSGLFPLAVVALIPVFAFSVGLGVLIAVIAGVYVSLGGMLWPRMTLLPVLAPALGSLGLGLVYPAMSGSAGRLKKGLPLALFGGVVFTFWQVTGVSPVIDYLGIANSFGVRAALEGIYNPLEAAALVAAPFQEQPALLAQPLIWLIAALPAALIVRRRHLLADVSGLIAANILLAAGYLALPLVVAGFSIDAVTFLKTLLLCVIIQFGLLLISPRHNLVERQLPS